MTGPRQDELVFPMSNTTKINVRFRTRRRYGAVARFFSSFVPNRHFRRHIKKSRTMVNQSEADITGEEGTCAALSAMYLKKSHELGTVTRRDDVEDTFKLAIAQAAFEKWGGTNETDTPRLLGAFQMHATNDDTSVPLIDTMQQIYDNPGRYMVYVWYADGSAHAVAMRNAGGLCYYFEPEEGLYQFASRDRFWEAVWTYLMASDLDEDSDSSWWLTDLD